MNIPINSPCILIPFWDAQTSKWSISIPNPPWIQRPAAQVTTWSSTPVVKNQPILTVRMGVVEPTQEIWLSLLDNYLILDDWQMISSSQYHSVLIVDFSRIFCPFWKDVILWENSPTSGYSRVSYGWKILRARFTINKTTKDLYVTRSNRCGSCHPNL